MRHESNSTFYAIDYSEMSCFSIMKFDFEDRCKLAVKVEECDILSTMVHYFVLMYCDLEIRSKVSELCALFFILVLVISLMVIISIVVESHFSPMLKVISMKMGLNEYVAGSTLLAIGNSLPDALANMLPVRSEAPMFAISISNSMAIVLVSGGMVCYLKPFKMNPNSTVRDLLVLILACETLTFILLRHKHLYAKDGIYLICGYFIYLIVIIGDLIAARMTVNSLRRQIAEANRRPASAERRAQIARMKFKLKELEKDHRLSIHRHKKKRRSSSWGDSNDSDQPHHIRDEWTHGFTTPWPKKINADVDFEETRTILHSSENSKNLFLFADFWDTVMPINMEEWGFCGMLWSAFAAIKGTFRARLYVISAHCGLREGQARLEQVAQLHTDNHLPLNNDYPG
ncbi:cation/calcium exchanger 5-like [Drosophila obscura]|uniref:cation/calcium exchanger 5-like n=1 Tax=Drosophila obscura TaxID=7282 RepID=UPI001BB1F28D|nr:cation/calcium exchanger 5-like [Drosophila obscura]